MGIAPLPGYLTRPSAPLGFVALVRGDYAAAIAHAEEVRRSGEAEDHNINRQFAYHVLSEAHMRQGDYETASAVAHQAYAMSQRSGDLWFSAYILNNMGQVASALGDDRMAASHFEKSYEIRRLFADPEGMRWPRLSGRHHVEGPGVRRGRGAYRRSLEIYQEINDQGGLATANRGLGAVACKRGHYAEAHDYFADALRIGVEINYRPLLLSLLVDMGEYLWLIGEQTRAFSLLTFTVRNPASDHASKARAEELLAHYGQQLDRDLLAEEVAGPARTLETVTAALLHDLALPPVVPIVEQGDPAAKGFVEPLVDPLVDPLIEPLHRGSGTC